MPFFQSQSEEETRQIATSIAASCKGKEIFLLSGPLGAGKSFFARAFIQSLIGLEAEVPSPTFTLVQTYDTPKGPLWHFDLYRLQHPDEIFEIGWEEALGGGMILAEWPQRLGPNIPRKARSIEITIRGDQARGIQIDG